jgi:hypothetical protein
MSQEDGDSVKARWLIGGPALLLLLACPGSPPDLGSSPLDEAIVWRVWLEDQRIGQIWLEDQGIRQRRMVVRDTTIEKTFSNHEISVDAALQFAVWEEEHAQKGEKATSEAMLELGRRLRAVIRSPRKIPSKVLPANAPRLLPSEQYERLDRTCDGCGWLPFRQAYPGFEGALALSRVAFFRSFAMLYAEVSNCGSYSGHLALLKFMDGRWTVTGRTGGSTGCGECSDEEQFRESVIAPSGQ